MDRQKTGRQARILIRDRDGRFPLMRMDEILTVLTGIRMPVLHEYR
ncbi:hypothetical protein [Nonomuraea sp. NPDC049480]